MAELVAGALLSSFLDVLFERLSSPEFKDLIKGNKLHKLLKRMKSSLNVVQVVLNDADRRQITETAVKDWLSDLEDAVYVADDLLDEVQTKAAIAQKHPGNNNFCSRHFKFNLHGRKMVAKIKKVTDKLEDIQSKTTMLDLVKNTPTETMSQRIPSTSLVETYDICGRDKDKEEIIRLLLDGEAKISVIPIVGMGGIGKTTLAQTVYNANNLEGIFDPKVWVCVGGNFDVVKMSKVVLEKISSPCNSDDLDSIQLKLKDKLTGKRFLVVLDDMWNISHDAWESFQKPFQNASVGSKIIVTTRNHKEVASMVRTVPAHKLKLLSDEHCWSVFKNHASLSPVSQDSSSLEKFRGKIVERCQGLPLAARTLGGLLRTKDNIREWDDVLNSQIWEFSNNDESRILAALRISYHYLPSYLKRCFVFCSLYPKDYQFDRDELILMWMAGDLLPSPRSGNSLEEIGYTCFNDLASRSFFQQSHYEENIFVMHDLMHDLAIFYAGKLYLRASEHGTATNVDRIARHVSYDVPDSKILETFESLKHARTLLQAYFDMFRYFPKETAYSISLLLSKLKCLRVLSIKCFPLHSLPDSIGELIHLRYLDLSKVNMVTLPKSLSKLYNLQTLKLRDCIRLKMLPSGMQDLVNMRHLDIRGTLSLKEMPRGMNKLKDLQFLSDYIVGRDKERGISQLGALTNLHGSLAIHQLDQVSNTVEASKAKMIDKVHIQDLEFHWWSSSGDNNIADFQAEKDILDKLQPCTELKELKIKGYKGQEFPYWLGRSCYQSMTSVTLSGCRNCRKLPSLGQLPCLKELMISYFDELCSIGSEFYQNDECCQETPFPSLETLRLVKLSKWQEWRNSSQLGAVSFPMLKELSINECPMLTTNLPNHLPASLQTLEVLHCKKLEFSMQQQQESLRSLTIDNSFDSLTSFPLAAFPNLTSLCIRKCENMKRLEVFTFASLSSLTIRECDNFVLFGEEGSDGSMMASLTTLEMEGCEKLVRCVASSRVLHGCSNLSYLQMWGPCDSVESLFPREGSLPASLERVVIGRFSSLERLDCNGLVHLTSLRDLSIGYCPKLDNIVGESFPASLQQLNILQTPLLGKRCWEQDQQIWPKISHIPTIQVDMSDIRQLRSSSQSSDYKEEKEEESYEGCFKCLGT